MTHPAPGKSAEQQEPVCYNCGTRGHWMPACPEPTRAIPAGLTRWKSQHQDSAPSPSDRNSSPRDKKGGAVVTRYQPPASQPSSSLARYGHPPGLPLPPPPLLPPPPQAPPLQAPSPQAYSQPIYPPPPSYAGGYPHPPPPPPQYGQYTPSDAPYPPHPPPQYGQQPPYGPPQYPPSYPPPPTYYSNTLPPPPPPHSFPHGAYPQLYVPPPGPPPAPPAYHPHFAAGPPPPPLEYHYSPGQPPPYGAVPPPPAHYPPTPGWNQPPYGPPPQLPPAPSQAMSNGHRGKRDKHQGSKRSHQNKDRYRPGNDKGTKNSPRVERKPDRRAVRDEQSSKGKDGQPSVSRPKDDEEDKEEDGEWDPTSAADLEKIFPEIEPTRAADPVGIPLAYVYNEEPTIPPKFDAKCIKSDFFDEESREVFGASIRETRSWPIVKRDPVFRKYPGMTLYYFPAQPHGYWLYERPIPPSPSAAIKMPPKYRIDRNARKATPEREQGLTVRTPVSGTDGHVSRPPLDGYQSRDSPSYRYSRDGGDSGRFKKRSLDDPSDFRDRDDHDTKRARMSGSRYETSRNDRHEVVSSADRVTPNGRTYLNGNLWSPQEGESAARAPNDHQFLDVPLDTISPSSREDRVPYSKMRHDSGYHSGQSQDMAPRSHRNADQGRQQPKRSYQKPRSPSRSRSRSRSRVSTDSSSRARSESPLTAMEAEILGLDDEPSDPKPKVAIKKPIRRVKVAAAFSRRW
ncbi:hypothetical protein B0T24DRAFT_137296 [Lasiosphaeria ovina]|uniref:CCHC-type domain-containing protein n=1 Tax=Lasiosphaeria ovina TaxID=92902 RepID=A0AAE0KMN0_9PEZI|nr:hypothetical protein B0T24DRAFT_137296 [Lasiosphaeria ovina]